MTREEAIERIQIHLAYMGQYEAPKTKAALQMAIAALNQSLPCKIGDTAYGIARTYGKVRVVPAKVTQMFYSDDMDLCMVVERVCRGKFGESVFLTKEEAESALRKMEEI